jgi:hypothetical protein
VFTQFFERCSFCGSDSYFTNYLLVAVFVLRSSGRWTATLHIKDIENWRRANPTLFLTVAAIRHGLDPILGDGIVETLNDTSNIYTKFRKTPLFHQSGLFKMSICFSIFLKIQCMIYVSLRHKLFKGVFKQDVKLLQI